MAVSNIVWKEIGERAIDRDLRPQNLLVSQGKLQGRLYLDVAESGDGEVQVLQRPSPLIRVVFQE